MKYGRGKPSLQPVSNGQQKRVFELNVMPLQMQIICTLLASTLFSLSMLCLPLQVDVLIVNCSLFGPTPSLAAMIINKFKMRSNIVTYNLGGMGCSAGLISISLAREMLQVYSNINVIVVSTENITQNW